MSLPRVACLIAVLVTADAGRADVAISLRLDDGRFLCPAEDGMLRPGRRFPGAEETFDLRAETASRVILAHARGLVAPFGPLGARQLRVVPAAAPGGSSEKTAATLSIVPVDGNRVALACEPAGELIRFAPAPASSPDATGKPDAGQIIAIYLVGQIPAETRDMLAQAIQSLVAQELTGQTYDKTRRRQKEKYVTLPAPTLNNPRRTKRHRVLATHEETRVRAELDGQPAIAITHMPFLKGYRRPQQGALVFVVDAEVPVLGHVGYRIPQALDVSTNFRARIRLSLVSQLAAARSGTAVTLDPPEVLAMEVQVLSLDISNDLLNSVRKAIRDFANEELRRKDAKIREQANKAIRKAVNTQEFRLPLLRYLLESGDEPEGQAEPMPGPNSLHD